MKKIYINPAIEIIKIATHHMLASSQTVNVTGTVGDPSAAQGHDDDFDW